MESFLMQKRLCFLAHGVAALFSLGLNQGALQAAEPTQVAVLGGAARLRAEGKDEAAVVALIPYGTRASVMETKEPWRRLTFPDAPALVGWMHQSLLGPPLEKVPPASLVDSLFKALKACADKDELGACMGERLDEALGTKSEQALYWGAKAVDPEERPRLAWEALQKYKDTPGSLLRVLPQFDLLALLPKLPPAVPGKDFLKHIGPKPPPSWMEDLPFPTGKAHFPITGAGAYFSEAQELIFAEWVKLDLDAIERCEVGGGCRPAEIERTYRTLVLGEEGARFCH